MAGGVVDLSGGTFERLEDDVLVEARDHPRWEPQASGVPRVERLPCGDVLPAHDLVEAIDADDAERRGELVHPEVEAWDGIVGLSVVAEVTREAHDVLVWGHEHAALTGRHGLRRGERPHSRIAPRACTASVPGRAVRVRAVLDQEDALRPAEGGDRLDLEGEVPPDVGQDRRARSVCARLRLE